MQSSILLLRESTALTGTFRRATVLLYCTRPLICCEIIFPADSQFVWVGLGGVSHMGPGSKVPGGSNTSVESLSHPGHGLFLGCYTKATCLRFSKTFHLSSGISPEKAFGIERWNVFENSEQVQSPSYSYSKTPETSDNRREHIWVSLVSKLWLTTDSISFVLMRKSHKRHGRINETPFYLCSYYY